VIPDRYHGERKPKKKEDYEYPPDNIMGKQLNNFILRRKGRAFWKNIIPTLASITLFLNTYFLFLICFSQEDPREAHHTRLWSITKKQASGFWKHPFFSFVLMRGPERVMINNTHEVSPKNRCILRWYPLWKLQRGLLPRSFLRSLVSFSLSNSRSVCIRIRISV